MAAVAGVTGVEEQRSRSADWALKYPPLFVLALALIVVATLLPSALNLPQANPSTTLEYAPVPPTDEDPQGESNTSSLGLGKSSSIEGEGASGGEGGGGGLELPDPSGAGTTPSVKRCFKHPDGFTRQTEDALSPPCVAAFNGNNFGATYQGVTEKEIRLVAYLEGSIDYISSSDAQAKVTPAGRCYDLLEQPKADEKEHLEVKAMRVWQKYFNDRFQTYKRTVHFYVCFSQGGRSPEGRRADAAKHFKDYKPFATVSFITEGNEDSYLKYMASKGVLNFGSFSLRDASFFQGYAKLIWSYYPSIEQHAQTYVSYICEKVVKPQNNKVVLSDNPGQNGQKRVLGMIHTSDKNRSGLLRMAEIVKKGVRECGGPGILEEKNVKNHPECCLAQDNRETPTYAAAGIAQMQQNGVTTVLWPGGINGAWGKAAESANFRPEWIVLGDGVMDGAHPVRLATLGPSFDGRAVIISPETFRPALQQQRCYQAFREVDTTMPVSDLAYACDRYTSIFQFFVGVQVAGPRLGPTSLDKGFHAIPQRKSGNPEVPACFYLPGDYTCVKDAQAKLWDNAGTPPGDNRPGCWRSIERGARYLAQQWPPGNIDAQLRGGEPCNGYDSKVTFYPYPA